MKVTSFLVCIVSTDLRSNLNATNKAPTNQVFKLNQIYVYRVESITGILVYDIFYIQSIDFLWIEVITSNDLCLCINVCICIYIKISLTMAHEK